MNNPLFLDLPKEEQENWKFLYTASQKKANVL